MAKRKHDDDGAGTSADVAPKRKKKNRPAQEKEQEAEKLPAMAVPKQEPGVTGEDEFEKGKKSGKKGVDDLDSRLVKNPEPEKKKKKKKKQEEEAAPLEDSQTVEDHGSAEPQRKKKKKSKEGNPEASTSRIVEDDGGAEPQREKKKKTKEVTVTLNASHDVEDNQGRKKKMKEVVPTVDASQDVEGGQGKKKKTKEVAPMPVTVEASHVEDNQGKKKKSKHVPVTVDALQVVEDVQRKKKKKKKTKEVAPTPVIEDGQGKRKTKKEVVPSPDASQIFEDGQGKKKKKVKKEVVTLEAPQTVEEGQGKKKKKKVTSKDPFDGTGSAKKTILKSQNNGADLDRKRKTAKKVTFQLPDRVEDEPPEKELSGGEETEFFEELTWKADKLRPGLVYGMYTPEEDGVLKKAIFDYIQEQGWDREEGLEKILKSRQSEARGCWHVIRKCLPQRELKRIYSRAHRILGPNTLLGKWSNEESQSLIELHSVHGNDWKIIGTIIGRDSEACKDKWRQLKWSKSKDFKSGAWSEEEHQKLCKLVLKCLHVKAQMAKKGLIPKTNRLIRDDINWEFIAEKMGGRSRLDCLGQWYRKMASPMVTTGEWSNDDDQRFLERLMEEFPLSEELVEWDSLLKNRSGETCKKRWEQMQRTLGRGPEVRHQHFLEKLESIIKRFAPHLLDTEYDQKFAEDMQRADDADESEDSDV